MRLVWHQLLELSIKIASWTLSNFGGCPKSLKWSSQGRPMTDFVRTDRPQTPDQPSLFLSLQILKAFHNICHPPTSSERRACGITSHPPIQPVSQPSQPSQPSQAGQAGLQASWHRFLRLPGFQAWSKGSIGDPARILRRATGRQALCPWKPGNPPNMPQTHQISMIWTTYQQIMGGGSFGSLISRPPDKAGQGEAPPCLQA